MANPYTLLNPNLSMQPDPSGQFAQNPDQQALTAFAMSPQGKATLQKLALINQSAQGMNTPNVDEATTPQLSAATEDLPKDAGVNNLRHVEQDTQTQFKGQTLQPQMATPERVQTLADLINQEQNRAYADQEKGIQKAEDVRSAYGAMPLQTNMQPINQMLDSWYGTKLAGNYKAPESAEDRMAMMAKLEDEIQKQRGGVSKNFLDQMKFLNQAGGTNIGNQVTTTTDKSGVTQHNQPKPASPAKTGTGFNQVARLVNTDKPLQTALAAEKEATQALHDLDTQSGVSDLSAVMHVAKSQVGGRLSNYDTQVELGGDPAVWQKVRQIIQKANEGTLTDVNRGEFRQMLQGIVDHSKNIKSNRLAALQAAGENITGDPAKVKKQLNPTFFDVGNPPPPAPEKSLIQQYMELKNKNGK